MVRRYESKIGEIKEMDAVEVNDTIKYLLSCILHQSVSTLPERYSFNADRLYYHGGLGTQITSVTSSRKLSPKPLICFNVSTVVPHLIAILDSVSPSSTT
jgi:hypothetical protein